MLIGLFQNTTSETLAIALSICQTNTFIERLTSVEVAAWIQCSISNVNTQFPQKMSLFEPFQSPDGHELSTMNPQDIAYHLNFREEVAAEIYSYIVRNATANPVVEWLIFSAPTSSDNGEYVVFPEKRQIVKPGKTYPAFHRSCQIPNLGDIYLDIFGYREDGMFVEVFIHRNINPQYYFESGT